MTGRQIGMIRALLNKAGLTAQKEDIVASFSDERTVHITDLTQKEAQEIVKYLNTYLGQEGNPSDKMRRKILSHAHEMHWELLDGRVDMVRVNNWCIRFSGKNKPLDQFKYSELPTLVSQFELVYTDYLKGI